MLNVFTNTSNIENINDNLSKMLIICFELSNDSISQYKRNYLKRLFENHLKNIIEENIIFADFKYDLTNAENSINTYKDIMNIRSKVL